MGAERVFAIGDIHGCVEELRSLLHQLPLTQDSVIVFLGDYIDRGPDSKGVVDTILDLTALYKVVTLKGNHEWLMEQYLANPENPVASGNFILNGGGSTLRSYSADGSTFTIPPAHREFFRKLLPSYATETHFFVHAGVPPEFDIAAAPDTRTTHQFLWIRNKFLESDKNWSKIIVHGHTPVEEVERLPNRINLDTGCVFGRRLTAMDMSSGRLYSVRRHQALAPAFLQHTEHGRTRARRFEGEVRVSLEHEGALLPFRTVNFNEFGLLIFPAPGTQPPSLAMGAYVCGRIEPGEGNVFRFEGAVVRLETKNGVPNFGIRFTELENLAETEGLAE